VKARPPLSAVFQVPWAQLQPSLTDTDTESEEVPLARPHALGLLPASSSSAVTPLSRLEPLLPTEPGDVEEHASNRRCRAEYLVMSIISAPTEVTLPGDLPLYSLPL